jgi:hypothetical protein
MAFERWLLYNTPKAQIDWYIRSELDVLENYKDKYQVFYPYLDKNGDYVLGDESHKEWVMKLDKQGIIHLSPKHILHYPYSFLICEYLKNVFGLDMWCMFRYTKFRIYVHRDSVYIGHKEYHHGPKVSRYIYHGPAQDEPILMNMRGEILSGAIQYSDKFSSYTTKW